MEVILCCPRQYAADSEITAVNSSAYGMLLQQNHLKSQVDKGK